MQMYTRNSDRKRKGDGCRDRDREVAKDTVNSSFAASTVVNIVTHVTIVTHVMPVVIVMLVTIVT